jgi:hypothetical protein
LVGQVISHYRLLDMLGAGGMGVGELGDTPRPLIGRVLYHWICGETDQAADWYERAINGRDPFALVFADGPLGSAFRESSRWPKLASMMKLTTAI